MNIPHFSVGDILIMKKAHPCGSNRFKVLRVGSDLKLLCLGCEHEISVRREKIEKNIKQAVSDE